MRDTRPITVDWLHSINWLQTSFPEGWSNERRGISHGGNWWIHSVVENGNYDDGPFVWTVMPHFTQNMLPLAKPRHTYAILVLEDREDVMRLLSLLERPKKVDACPTCGGTVFVPPVAGTFGRRCVNCCDVSDQAMYGGGRHDWCANSDCPKCNRRLAAEKQSYDDLAASGGIVDAP